MPYLQHAEDTISTKIDKGYSMADEVDLTAERMEAEHSANLAEICRKASNIPKGEPGDCELCGEWSGRLVNGVCAPCRDRYKLP
jgi:hypothetical protein